MTFASLEGKTALVTGGNRGIGKVIAQNLKAAGANVIICGSNEISLKESALELGVQWEQADFSNVENVKEMATRLLNDNPEGIDILVNNAGISDDGLFVRQKHENLSKVMTINFESAVELSRVLIAPMMKKRAGRIINVTSIIGHIGNAGQTSYAASKAGMLGFTKSLAKEIARRGITVNAIAPGFIETEMTQKLPEKIVEDYKASIPLARFGSPDDVASAVRFLASDDAGYITGTTIHVNGGLYV